jgi:hypothetical protein
VDARGQPADPQVKSPQESKRRDDIYKLLATAPGDEAYLPLRDGSILSEHPLTEERAPAGAHFCCHGTAWSKVNFPIALSEVANVIRHVAHGRGRLMALKAYFDDTGTDPRDPWLDGLAISVTKNSGTQLKQSGRKNCIGVA